ncbi:unnamed protein product [Vitrella brassicaformis CCMP3155]|uniref:PH domain-containing protein n=2 Tax=Vitrella brassicaformis TaxID=1169539 RepID=A0A0G4ETV2_VITBC|nr:unnamed protein product [Vitrella brassicaformis CCMP3155]|eukprot:CEM01809.1 unnamed protein product [Vitrella brassicaformis CCMP3155]
MQHKENPSRPTYERLKDTTPSAALQPVPSRSVRDNVNGSDASPQQGGVGNHGSGAGSGAAATVVYQRGRDEPVEYAESDSESDDEGSTAVEGEPGEPQTPPSGDPPHRLTEMRGFLQKKSSLIGWATRFFVLRERKLTYYRHQYDRKPRGTLDSDLIQVQIECLWDPQQPPPRPQLIRESGWTQCITPVTDLCCRGKLTVHLPEVGFRIYPKGVDRVFELKGPYDEVQLWVAALKYHIASSRPPADHQQLLAHQPKFWKFDRITPSRFETLAQTGDILLFCSTHRAAKIQRAITGSHYDHVALVLRFADGRLAFFEAAGGVGVGVVTWRDFIAHKWHLLYPKLAVRRLTFERTNERLLALEAFVKASCGKPYLITTAKLLRREKQTGVGESETYFCSELVADALKILQVLPNDIPSSDFWPSSFARNNECDLVLSSGAEMGDEHLIDFNLEPGYESSDQFVRKKRKDKTDKRDD